MINHLDKHRVGISVLMDRLGEGYIGKWDGLVLPLVGLEQGIRNTYNIIKSQLRLFLKNQDNYRKII
jgi:hypothetical protein